MSTIASAALALAMIAAIILLIGGIRLIRAPTASADC